LTISILNHQSSIFNRKCNMVVQQETNKQLIQQRINLCRLPVLLVFFLMAARLWQLQVIQGSEYALKAEHNRIRTIELLAPRGTISDRNNIPLVENRPSFDVLLYREEVKDKEATARFLAEKLGIPPEEFEAKLRRSKSSGLYHPILIKEDAGMQDISVIEAHKRDHPEIQLGPQPRRLYHYGKLAAHLLGYVGEISEQDLGSDAFPGSRVGSLVGQAGIERAYNNVLIGKDGERRVQVDSVGREVGLVNETESVIGGEILLTIDLDLQSVAEKALEGKVGAIVAMDPRNGEILVMASSPSFDPNAFSPHISTGDWNSLVSDPDHPMQNRVIQNSYSPGSVFKLIMAETGLEEGLFDEDPVVVCHGAATYYGRVFHCSHKEGHGALRLEQAIAKSCNIFFYELGRRLGISKISEHAHALGLGERTGVDLPNERSGVMPSPEWKMKTSRTKWYVGETISVSIGQGAVSTTPLQIIRAVSAIATGGLVTTPHLLKRAEAGGNANWPVRRIAVAEEKTRRIKEGMWQSVNNYGTGYNAAIPGLDICGKTGTVQVVGNENKKLMREDSEDHSWFAGFASRDNPEIAVTVFIEHGGKGGVAAAPLAKQIFATYFEKRKNAVPRSPSPAQILSQTGNGKRETRNGLQP
jgi:penicillin-binding protein 2